MMEDEDKDAVDNRESAQRRSSINPDDFTAKNDSWAGTVAAAGDLDQERDKFRHERTPASGEAWSHGVLNGVILTLGGASGKALTALRPPELRPWLLACWDLVEGVQDKEEHKVWAAAIRDAYRGEPCVARRTTAQVWAGVAGDVT